MNSVLIVHTAFPGDIILTLPMAQRLRSAFPHTRVAMITIPQAADLLRNHPAIDDRILYDKKGSQRGMRSLLRLARDIHKRRFDVALIPHRSLRSALIGRLAGIPRRIGFASSAGKILLTDRVADDRAVHEISRNLSLLGPLGVAAEGMFLPDLYPDDTDRAAVDAFLAGQPGLDVGRLVAVAPGSVWNTKRWIPEHFAGLIRRLVESGLVVVLVGGEGDRALCREIHATAGARGVLDASGAFSLLQSAEVIRRCRVCVSNDSAPMHLAVAMRTPVVALFGATVPEFGFGPTGPDDVVVQTSGLSCRPCSIHGGRVCPIQTFECMHRIAPERVAAEVMRRCG
jgi:heptosyltransferase-2